MTEQALKFVGKVDEAAILHEEIARMDKRLKELKRELAEMALFKDGSKTGHVYGAKWHATVGLKETVRFDQERLAELRTAMGDREFFRVFKWSFEPASKKLLDAAIEFGAHGEAIRRTFTVVPASPQVTFKPMEDR